MPSLIPRLLRRWRTPVVRHLECFFCGDLQDVLEADIQRVTLKLPRTQQQGRKRWARQTGSGKGPFPYTVCTRWECPTCGSSNVRDENGEIVDNLPEMYDLALNRATGAARAAANPIPSQPVFCRECQENQRLIIHMLSEYIPSEDDPEFERYAATAEAYRQDLEHRYPLTCCKCQKKVEEEIRRRNRPIWAARLDKVLHESYASLRMPPGLKSPGVKPIIEPVPLYKQVVWLIWGIIWLLSWLTAICIHIQGLFLGPAGCAEYFAFADETLPLPELDVSGNKLAALASNFVVRQFYLADYAAGACLMQTGGPNACTCQLRQAWSTVMILSVLSIWFNPLWRRRAVRGATKPLAGWRTYKKYHLLAAVIRLGNYFAVTPNINDVVAKIMHMSLLAANLMILYDALVSIGIFARRPEGVTDDGGRRVADLSARSTVDSGMPNFSPSTLDQAAFERAAGEYSKSSSCARDMAGLNRTSKFDCKANWQTQPVPSQAGHGENGLLEIPFNSLTLRGSRNSDDRGMEWTPSCTPFAGQGDARLRAGSSPAFSTYRNDSAATTGSALTSGFTANMFGSGPKPGGFGSGSYATARQPPSAVIDRLPSASPRGPLGFSQCVPAVGVPGSRTGFDAQQIAFRGPRDAFGGPFSSSVRGATSSGTASVGARQAADPIIRPQTFFPPEDPTGLENLLEAFKLDDGSALKRSLNILDKRLCLKQKITRLLFVLGLITLAGAGVAVIKLFVGFS